MSRHHLLVIVSFVGLCAVTGACSNPGPSSSSTGGATAGSGSAGTTAATQTSAGASSSDPASPSTSLSGGSSGPGATTGTTGGVGDGQEDDFERSELGPNWRIVFPKPPKDAQVQIVDDSDLGMGPGPEGFFLVNWIGSTFGADQYSEGTIPLDATQGWIYQVYVRWREADAARYGFGYNGDPNQPSFGNWIFKYDGVPSPQTRVFATAPAVTPPAPGDTLRLEIQGYTLRGYHNGQLVLEAEDTDPSRIAAGEPGLAARWANGNMGTPQAVKVWERWAGGSL